MWAQWSQGNIAAPICQMDGGKGPWSRGKDVIFSDKNFTDDVRVVGGDGVDGTKAKVD